MNSSEQTLLKIEEPAKAGITIEELKYMAYTGQHELVTSLLREMSPLEREKFSDKEILHQAIWGSVERIRKLRTFQNHKAINTEIDFLKIVIDQFFDFCKKNRNYPRELFQAKIYVAEELINVGELDKALSYLELMFEMGVQKFPQLRVEAVNKIALVLGKRGNLEQSIDRLERIAKQPYFIIDKNQVPQIFFSLSQYYIQKGNTENYKYLLFLGLNYFYKDENIRRKFFNQLHSTFKKSWKLITNRNVLLVNKLIFLLHWFYFKIPNFHRIKIGFINKIAFKALLGFIYIFYYHLPTENLHLYRKSKVQIFPRLLGDNKVQTNSQFAISNKTSKNILITRAMGGVGDLLMMTPGIRELKKKYPKREIHLAIPNRYFSIFSTNTDVKLVDIEDDSFSHLNYSKWFNFTDCPASRLESRKAPKVKKNRTELFASGLGIKGLRLLRMDHRPVYSLSEDEKEFAKDFWCRMNFNDKKVIGIQLHTDESYRDYPLIEKLVEKISKNYAVLLFDNSRIDGFNFGNAIKIDSFPIREAFALASKCNLIIAPDSAFIHFAAAFDLPSIGLFGPIDGKVRTKHYSNCTYIDVREQLGCLPCWRNEDIPCKLTGMRHSACMESISLQKIVNEVELKLNGVKNERN